MKKAGKKASENFLFEYLNSNSPTSAEAPGQQLWLEYIKPFVDDYMVDNYGTAVGIINPGQPYKVVIEAHVDEISWFVNYISPEGILHLIRNGGSDHIIAPSMRAHIHTKKGIVKGVFGWPAIHVRKDRDEAPKVDGVYVDCGCSNKEEVAEMGIHVGTIVTFEGDSFKMNDRFYVGRALDNRMGGYMIAEVARKIHEKGLKLPYTLYVVNSVQEEIGLRGAEMIAATLKPNVAICTDVTHHTLSAGYDKKVQGEMECGKGPVVCYGPAVQNNLRELIIDTAEKNEIPFQRQAVSRSTGTDTDSFAYSSGGIVSALISLPLKYMHTTVETVHEQDVKNVIKLIYHTLERIEAGQDFRYFK